MNLNSNQFLILMSQKVFEIAVLNCIVDLDLTILMKILICT